MPGIRYESRVSGISGLISTTLRRMTEMHNNHDAGIKAGSLLPEQEDCPIYRGNRHGEYAL